MGFIQQSTTKKIYAYLTQFAKGKILDGNEEDFTVKYFSLHDTDVNYNISANIVNNSYNTLPSGFIPDITGDNQGCLFSIANGVQIENTIEQPPQPTSLVGTVTSSCEIGGTQFEPVRTGRYQINVTNIQGGTGEGYFWYVKTDVISFTSATSTNVAEAIILSSTTSDVYAVGTPQFFNATFNFADTYLPREADSYNFTVYAKDSSGIEVEIGKFTDINCSKRTFGVVSYAQDALLDYQPLNLITEDQLNGDDAIDYISRNKYGFALFIIDNGNRRRDLNITTEDLSTNNPNVPYFAFKDYLFLTHIQNLTNCVWSVQPDKFSVRIPFNDTRDVEEVTGEHSESVLINGAIVRTQTEGVDSWRDYMVGAGNLVPTSVFNNPSYIIYKGNFDALHPTVKPFNNMNLDGFKISYVEIAPKYDPDNVPSQPSGPPVGIGSLKSTLARYKMVYDGTPNPNIVINPPEIGGTFVNLGIDLEYSWSIFYPNVPCN